MKGLQRLGSLRRLQIRVSILDLDIPTYHCANSCSEEKDFEVVKNTVDLYLMEWIQISGGTHYVGYLTDSPTNFRIDRAFTWPYKGHRKSEDKPSWYGAIREYLQDHWQAQLLSGVEADDGLAMAQTYYHNHGIDSVIVTEDKDLLQVPGLHYNKHKNHDVFKVSEEQGHFNLWSQVITGDKTDNIPGVSHAASETVTGKWNQEVKESDRTLDEKTKARKPIPRQELYGPVSASNYLLEFDPEDWPAKVWELYVDKYEDGLNDEGYGDLRFLETFDLIYMLREPPEGLEITFNFHEAPAQDGVLDLLDF